MLPNVLPVEASHSSLDVFERAPLLITFDSSFEQRIGPLYTPNGPTLEFVVTGDRTNSIDLRNIYLEVKCNISAGTVMLCGMTRRVLPTLICQFL